MLKDTGYKNKDGSGLYSESVGVIKTEKAFNTISWRNFFSVNKSKTIIGHVRAATASRSGKREISVDNSHPYEIDGVILAHNGSVATKVGYVPRGVVDLESTDSLNFFRDVMYTKTTEGIPVIDAIVKTMNNYTGKFALLVFDGADYYALRGKTATLFKSTIYAGEAPVAVFVNTDETDLKDSMTLAVHLYALIYDTAVDFKLEALEKETIYKLNGLDLCKVGEIKENDPPVTQRTIVPYNNDDYNDDYYYRNGRYITPTTGRYSPLYFFPITLRQSLDSLIKMKISPDVFDKWALATVGISATCLSEEQILSIVAFIEKYQEWCTNRNEIVADYYKNNNRIHALITKIKKANMKEEVQWPFELNTQEDLEDILKGEKK